jgi:hypothetical protein
MRGVSTREVRYFVLWQVQSSIVSSILDGLVSGDGENTGKVEWNTRNGISGWSKLKSPQNGPTKAKDQFSGDDEIEM